MRATLAWEGFRDRWSSRDSAGVGISDVSEVALPVIVVGHDNPDEHALNVGAARGTSGGGLFPGVAIEPRQSQDGLYVQRLEVYSPAGVGGAFPFVQLLEVGQILALSAVGTAFLRAPTQGVVTRATVAPGLAVVGGSEFSGGVLAWELPGCFVPTGSALVVAYAVANAALSVVFTFREA